MTESEAAIVRETAEEPAAASRRIDLSRLTMNAFVAGEGRPVVFIHGLGWDHSLWQRQTRRLSSRYLVVAADTRGHGASDKPPGPYSIDMFVEDWAGLCDYLGIEQAVFVGFSLGGMIAQRLALLRPDLIGGLVLAGTTCRVPESSRAHMEQRIAAMKSAGPRAAAEVAARSVFSEKWRTRNADRVASFVQWRSAQDHAALHEVMRAASHFDVSADIHSIDAPALALVGTEDALMPAGSQMEIAQRLPNCETAAIDAGHMMSIEQPEQFDIILDDFLARRWPPSLPIRR